MLCSIPLILSLDSIHLLHDLLYLLPCANRSNGSKSLALLISVSSLSLITLLKALHVQFARHGIYAIHKQAKLEFALEILEQE